MTHVVIDEALLAGDAWLRAPWIEALRDGLRLELDPSIWVCESWLQTRLGPMRRALRPVARSGQGPGEEIPELGRAARVHVERQEQLALDVLRVRLGAKLAPDIDRERLILAGELDPYALDDVGAWGVACSLALNGERTLLLTDDVAGHEAIAARFANRSWPKPEIKGPLAGFLRDELHRLPELSDAMLLEAGEGQALQNATKEALGSRGADAAISRLLSRNGGWELNETHVGEPHVAFVDLDQWPGERIVVATILACDIDVELVCEQAFAESGGAFISYDPSDTRWVVMQAQEHVEFELRAGRLEVRERSGLDFDVR